MTKELTFRTRTTTAGTVIELTGELDHRTMAEARTALSGITLRTGQQLVLDLEGLTFCDSSGISMMIAVRNHALAADATIALAAVPARVARVLRVVGLDQVFPTHSTARDAEDSWHIAPG